jgi:hypothetical protein
MGSMPQKKVIDKSTGIVYQSIKNAAECAGIKPNTLVSKLLGRNKNDTNFIYA